MLLTPAPNYRKAFSLGMTGTDVVALQLNLPIAEVTGEYDRDTQKVVRNYQQRNGLFVDGVAGLATQGHIVARRSRASETHYKLPTGMLKSLASNESSFAVAAFTWHPSDMGFDLGPFQKSIVVGSIGDQGLYEFAYDARRMGEYAAQDMRATFNEFSDPVMSFYSTAMAGGNRRKFRWLLAVLNHNWPYAAYGLHDRGTIFVEAERDTQPAGWVEEASGGTLLTPRQWVLNYVQRSTAYVAWE